MIRKKEIQVTGPYGTYNGSVVIEIDEIGKNEKHTYHNRSTHDDEEGYKRVYNHVIKSCVLETTHNSYSAFKYINTHEKDDIIEIAAKVENELREHLSYLANHDLTDPFQKQLKELGYE